MENIFYKVICYTNNGIMFLSWYEKQNDVCFLLSLNLVKIINKWTFLRVFITFIIISKVKREMFFTLYVLIFFKFAFKNSFVLNTDWLFFTLHSGCCSSTLSSSLTSESSLTFCCFVTLFLQLLLLLIHCSLFPSPLCPLLYCKLFTSSSLSFFSPSSSYSESMLLISIKRILIPLCSLLYSEWFMSFSSLSLSTPFYSSSPSYFKCPSIPSPSFSLLHSES